MGRGFGDYLAYDMLRAAVKRQSEVIGEAFAGLRRADPAPPRVAGRAFVPAQQDTIRSAPLALPAGGWSRLRGA